LTVSKWGEAIFCLYWHLQNCLAERFSLGINPQGITPTSSEDPLQYKIQRMKIGCFIPGDACNAHRFEKRLHAGRSEDAAKMAVAGVLAGKHSDVGAGTLVSASSKGDVAKSFFALWGSHELNSSRMAPLRRGSEPRVRLPNLNTGRARTLARD
jgi:hypothetical protein